MVTVSVYFDFSRAFDRVRHDLLLRKLHGLGFSSHVLRWLASYLNDRQLAVRDANGDVSAWSSLLTGVPQGSVLGPLLFTLYLTDFRDIPLSCRYHFYADDLQIYTTLRDLGCCIDGLNEDIGQICSWAEDCNLVLNEAKTKAMILGTPRSLGFLDLSVVPPIRVNSAVIPYSQSVTCLGVRIACTLSWNPYVHSVVKKMNSTHYQLRVNHDCLPRSLRVKLVSTLIFSYLDYCCLVQLDITDELSLTL